MRALRKRAYVGFPPGSRFLMLPRRPRRAARAGLALWEAVEPRQRLAVRVGGGLTRTGLHALLPRSVRPEVDWGWWERWVAEVAEPALGPVGHLAFRVPGNPRVSAIITDRRGRPIGFGKIVHAPTAESAALAGQLLGERPLRAFRVPATLAEGELDGRWYRLLQPLPAGPHVPPRLDPPRVWAIVDELRDRLAGLPRPAGTPDHHVVCHGDLTPRNLRVTGDGQWWLFDWDLVRWGPRLADELRYWSAAFAYRWRPRVERDSARVAALLRRRGTDADIREAVSWPNQVRQTYRDIEPRLHAAVGELAAVTPSARRR